MSTALDDLLDRLFNPFAPREGEGLVNPYTPPTSGTPSLTDPEIYVPPPNAPPGPGPYVPYDPPPLIPDGGDDNGDDNGGPGPSGPGPSGPGPSGPGPSGPGPSGPGFGPTPPGGSNLAHPYGGDYYAIEGDKLVRYTIQNAKGVDPSTYTDEQYYGSPISGHYITGQTVVGDAGEGTYAIEGSSGTYGEGIYYKDGRIYQYASPETLANLREEGRFPVGVDPSLMTDLEKAQYRMTYQAAVPDGSLGTSDFKSYEGVPEKDAAYLSGSYGAGNTVTTDVAKGIGSLTETLDGGEITEKQDPSGVNPIVASLYGDPTKGTPVDVPYESSFEYFREQQNAAPVSEQPLLGSEIVAQQQLSSPNPMTSLQKAIPMAPQPPPMAPPPMAPPPMAPPPRQPTPYTQPVPSPQTPPPMAPPPMAPPPPPMAPPPSAPPTPTPEQQAAIQKALEQMYAGQINFNQGGPVESGVGSLFLREVMR